MFPITIIQRKGRERVGKGLLILVRTNKISGSRVCNLSLLLKCNKSQSGREMERPSKKRPAPRGEDAQYIKNLFEMKNIVTNFEPLSEQIS